jgi:hypothetical protein
VVSSVTAEIFPDVDLLDNSNIYYPNRSARRTGPDPRAWETTNPMRAKSERLPHRRCLCYT